MRISLAVIPGDGIGPDIVAQAVRVLDRIGEIYGHDFSYRTLLAGGAAIDRTGVPLPDETLQAAKESDSVLLGAVGGPKWDGELTGGIYFGKRGRTDDEAYDTMSYTKGEVERIAVKAFEIAMKRNGRLTSVDKANILETSRLWRATVDEVAKAYPDVTVNHLYVDNAAMQLVRNPKQFDVILTENMFGDILSDEASMITGSIGMLPSASLRSDSFGMYEPIHGSAPDIAGQDKANPLATILSVAMMLRYSFDLKAEADALEMAVDRTLDQGWRTADIFTEGMRLCGTKAMGQAVVDNLE